MRHNKINIKLINTSSCNKTNNNRTISKNKFNFQGLIDLVQQLTTNIRQQRRTRTIQFKQIIRYMST